MRVSQAHYMPLLTRNRWLVALTASIGCHVVLGRLAGAAVDEAPVHPAPPVWTSAWVGDTVDVETLLSSALPAAEPRDSIPAPAQPSPAAPPVPEEPSRQDQPPAPAAKPPPKSRPSPPPRDHRESEPARAPSQPASKDGTGDAEQGDSHTRAAAAAFAFRPSVRQARDPEAPPQAGSAHAERGGGSSSSGTVGMPSGVRDLAAALTRNLPIAAQREPSWEQVALGSKERCVLRVSLNDEGRVSDWELVPLAVGEHPKRIKELARRAVALLGRGQFGVKSRFGAGAHRVELVVRVEQGAAHNADFVRPEDLFAQGSVPPTGARPGKAYLRLNSGRTLRMELSLQPE